MRWQVFCHGNDTFNLSHLEQFDHVFEVAAGVSYSITIRFSHHCFTEHTKPTDDPALLLTVGSDQRTFDFERWRLSHYLPEIIKTLEQRYISHTNHQSFFTVELIEDAGQMQDYEVYFDVTKDSKTKRLYLTVKSAYTRDTNRKNERPKSRKIRLLVILRNIQHNKPIRSQ
jgi:hypothetical protein